MFEIQIISRYSLTWLKSQDFFGLYSQLTECEEIDDKKFENWFNEMINNPLFVMFGVIKSEPQKTGVELVGTACLYIQPRYYRSMSSSATIEDFVIDSEYRGQQLGSLLLSKIISYAKERKFYKLTLQCDQDLEAFYSKSGFISNKSAMEYYIDNNKCAE